MIDLVCLVACKNIEAVIGAALQRHESLGVRQLTHKITPHPQRDSACFHRPEPLLQPFLNEARHALVVLDRAWEGAKSAAATDMENDLDSRLAKLKRGWGKAIVIDPEVEAWLFRRSPRLEEKLGWHRRTPGLTEELAKRGLWPEDAAKPADPKAAIEWALRQVWKPRSSAIYREIAAVLGMKDCVDPSFTRFRATLQSWFPPT